MKITLYTAPACPFCMIVKNFLTKNGVSFSEVDISKDKKAEQEMQKISGQSSVPVVIADGQAVVGYDLRKLKEVLKLK